MEFQRKANPIGQEKFQNQSHDEASTSPAFTSPRQTTNSHNQREVFSKKKFKKN